LEDILPANSVSRSGIYFEDCFAAAQRDAVLFFNGSLSSSASWHPMRRAFEEVGVRVVLHDYRGQGRSEADESPLSFRRHVEDALTLLDELGIERVHVIGTSYGSIAAQLFAAEHPTRTLSLALIEGLSEMDANTRYWVQNFVEWAREALQGPAAKARFYWNILPLFFSPDYAGRNSAVLTQRAEAFSGMPDAYFRGVIRIFENQLANLPITSELTRIACPTCVVWSELDVLTPRPLTDVIVRSIPQAEVVVLPGTGHVAIAERPGQLGAILSGFVRQHQPRSGTATR
jgi:3-oxoadipate enol-lactonase